jgi:hypothetical protein
VLKTKKHTVQQLLENRKSTGGINAQLSYMTWQNADISNGLMIGRIFVLFCPRHMAPSDEGLCLPF